ncbi:hypothetical protein ACFO0Q_14330, partial [Chryseobacterium bernardetii]|uniref:hypothetical protein n=1 Tax=Chryseobacterium bernardetii TaxID=1241978 RepID=UPI00360CF019
MLFLTDSELEVFKDNDLYLTKHIMLNIRIYKQLYYDYVWKLYLYLLRDPNALHPNFFRSFIPLSAHTPHPLAF